MNILGIVVFSIFFGVMCSKMGPAGKPLLDFFEALHVATMKLTMLVIWYSPIGIIFLVATKLIEMEDPSVVFIQLGYYMLTVLAGLAVHGFIVLPLVYFVAARRNPFVFMYNMLKALLTAWGTASSSATLPVTMECLEHRNKIDIRVAKFVAPIGATVNMDGTALYEAVAAIFIAQVNGITLNVGEVITISLTATAAAIGAAGIPSAGLVTMAIVLTAVGLPIDDIRLIYAIDWFLDRFRTAINVLGDSYGAGIVEKLSQADLARFDQEHGLDADNEISVEETIPEMEKENGGINNPTFTKF
ncbi:excitatory amino acid transporter 1-like [Ruditapes philippinarum]|uniref:excitatory amino acid transporter 1-like n=1 Tax=Ruditapes philippinarum TaxID=129788 RepID=UPI00295A6D0B|nr:excitatory amino acid transporter 1-like [Ruditapes philippinarum]